MQKQRFGGIDKNGDKMSEVSTRIPIITSIYVAYQNLKNMH